MLVGENMKKIFYDLTVFVDESEYTLTFNSLDFVMDYVTDLYHKYRFVDELFIERREIDTEDEKNICKNCKKSGNCKLEQKMNYVIACVEHEQAGD
jgi:hypothetical protein